MLETRVYQLWLFVKRAPDVPGQWVGHCLDLDVVSVGESCEQAFRMAAEAAGMVLEDDLNRGADPLARRAPQDLWDELFKFAKSAKRVELSTALSDEDVSAVAAYVPFALHRQVTEHSAAAEPGSEDATEEYSDVEAQEAELTFAEPALC